MLRNLFYKLKHWMEIIHWNIVSDDRRIELLREKGVKIGKGCVIFKNVKFGSEPYLISIGNKVRLTSNVKFITHDGGLWVLRNLHMLDNVDKFGEIKIGNNVHVGWDVTIMPGVTIGDNCIIGVGAIVTKDIPNNSVAVGVPAKVIESIEDYYLKNKDCVVYTKNMDKDEKKTYLLKRAITKNNI